MNNSITLILVLSLSATLLGSIAFLLIKFYRMRTMMIKAHVENFILKDKIDELLTEQNARDLEKTDGFLKFVSDSREWAFNYIEEVQDKLAKFNNDLDSILDYYSVYGPDTIGLHVDLAKDISKAYADLKAALPKENGKV